MTLQDIANLRLHNQQIAGKEFNSPKDIVGWMGAIQAQDYNMAKWAVGLRLPDSTYQIIENSIDRGEIIRTHLLRPTWHLVSANDIHWMLDLTGLQIKASLKSGLRDLEITDTILKKSCKVIEDALRRDKQLTREGVALQLSTAKIATDNTRLSHLLMWAELEGLICSGESIANKPSYALLEDKVSKPKSISRESALEMLAGKYFQSHGPATMQDFKWWSGLSIKDARDAIEMVQGHYLSVKIGDETYWLSKTMSKMKSDKSSVFLLPAFDEFIISYKDRTASLLNVHNKRTISENGIFRPVIILNGQVIGLWKRQVKKDNVFIEIELFNSSSRSIINKIELAAEKLGHFLNKKVQVKSDI